MTIARLLQKKPVFSFEFFPPKTPSDAKALRSAISELRPLKPGFVSVTQSPDGVASLRTAALSGVIKSRFGLETMAHLTCISHSRRQIDVIAGHLKNMGIKNVLALRGDKPENFRSSSDFAHADELVRHLAVLGGFCIGVAGYPEKHPEAASLAEDVANLKRKIDSGAQFIITQLFFENSHYFRFVEKCRKAGISVPIIPGIMPVARFGQLKRIAELCGAKIPSVFERGLFARKSDAEAVAAYGTDYALNQCRELLSKGAPGIHFYTFNKSKSARQILRALKSDLS